MLTIWSPCQIKTYKQKRPNLNNVIKMGKPLNSYYQKHLRLSARRLDVCWDFTLIVFRSWGELSCIMEMSLRCVPVKVRPLQRPCLFILMPLLAKGYTLSLLTNTCQLVTQQRWERFIAG